VLWESNAIVRYLCAQYGMGRLCPEDLKSRADVDRWMDWQAATLYYPVFREFYIAKTRVAPEQQNAARMEQLRKDILAVLGVLEAHLQQRPYVGGEALTMGDIPLGAVVDKWLRMDVDRPSMPALDGYYARLCQRPAFRERVCGFAVDAV
jgi:glutathione S-transferase